MSAKLSERDEKLIKELIKAKVLQNIQKHLINQSNGVILVTCADGDRFPEIFQHQVRLQKGCRSDPRIHTLAWNGGALACAPNSPINKRNGDEKIFIDQITAARKLKKIHQAVVEAHWVCGMAALFHLTAEEALALLVSAKDEIKLHNPGMRVTCFFPVDFGTKQRTFFFSRRHWKIWAHNHGIIYHAGC